MGFMTSGEVEQIARLFVGMGAAPDSARVMASQLMKRSEQIAAEQGIERVEALDGLLRAAIRGRQGLPPPRHPLHWALGARSLMKKLHNGASFLLTICAVSFCLWPFNKNINVIQI